MLHKLLGLVFKVAENMKEYRYKVRTLIQVTGNLVHPAILDLNIIIGLTHVNFT